jgi:hypothetical protein
VGVASDYFSLDRFLNECHDADTAISDIREWLSAAFCHAVYRLCDVAESMVSRKRFET